ncbi:hypothetical protein KAR10_09610, partial [bacterium]|nr:hypothetical protein [bacterium]
IKRSRDFHTPVGTFSYRELSISRYSISTIYERSEKNIFLMATPEKALIDKVWADKRISGIRISDYEAYLLEDLRLDYSALAKLDLSRLNKIAQRYASVKIKNLLIYIKRTSRSFNA